MKPHHLCLAVVAFHVAFTTLALVHRHYVTSKAVNAEKPALDAGGSPAILKTQ